MDASIISVALISLFFFFVVLGFICGWVRGLNKSLVRILIVLCMAVLAFFIVPPITKAILTMNISKFNLVIADTPVMTVQDLVGDLIRKVPFISDIVDASPTFEGFIEVMPQMLVNVVLFVVVFFLLKWISMIIYWIVAGVCFNKKKMAGKEKHGFIGAVVGAVQGLIVALVVFVPVFGVIDTAKPVVNAIRAEATAETETNSQGAQEGNDAISKAVDEYGVYFDAADQNWVFKTLGAVGVRQLSDAMFDGLTTVKVKITNGTTSSNVKYSLRKEVKTIANVYPDFRTVTNGGFNIRNNETIEALKNIVNKLYESPVLSGMIREVIPSVARTWRADENATFCGVKRPMFESESVNKMFDALLRNLENPVEPDAIKNDIVTGIELIELCNKEGILDVVAGDKDIMDVLNHPEGEDGVIIKVINKALESTTFKAVLPEVVDIGMHYVYDILEITVDATIGTVDETDPNHGWSKETQILQNIFTDVYKVYDDINKAGEGSDPLHSLNFEALGKVFDDMRESKLLGASAKEIIIALLDSKILIGEGNDVVERFKTSIKTTLEKDEPISFASTFKALGDALDIAREMQDVTQGELNLDKLKDVVKNLNENKEALGDVINDVLDPEMLDSLGMGDAAGVVSDVLGSIVNGDYSEEGSIDKEIEAAEELFNAANSVLATEEGQQANFDKDKTDELVGKLAESEVLLDALVGAGGDNTATQDLLKDKLSDDTMTNLEQSIEGLQGVSEEKKQALKDLFGLSALGA